KVDSFQRQAMDSRLGLRQPAEDAQGQFALAGRQAAALQDLFDLGKKAVRVVRRRLDADMSGAETALADLFDLNRDRQSERVDPGEDGSGIHPGIDECRQRHVAADAAETVEVGYTHCSDCSAVKSFSTRERRLPPAAQRKSII